MLFRNRLLLLTMVLTVAVAYAVAAPAPQAAATQFRQAPEAQIHDAITAIYDERQAASQKPHPTSFNTQALLALADGCGTLSRSIRSRGG